MVKTPELGKQRMKLQIVGSDEHANICGVCCADGLGKHNAEEDGFIHDTS